MKVASIGILDIPEMDTARLPLTPRVSLSYTQNVEKKFLSIESPQIPWRSKGWGVGAEAPHL